MDVVLVGEGVELTDALIKRIKDMGITAVYVEGTTKPKKLKEEVLKELNERFKKTENEPHMYLLKKVIRESIEEMYE
jgi:predicted nucleotidyltransferase